MAGPFCLREQLGASSVFLYLPDMILDAGPSGDLKLHKPRKALNLGKALLAGSAAALLLTSCTKHRADIAESIGHTYPVAVDMPPPVSPRILFSAQDTLQNQQAFNVVGLKSALMVAALSCNEQPQYDAFMSSFQPHVYAAQKEMDSYFHKASGPYSGQQMEDTFITNLANNQSVAGIAQGAQFCLNSQAEFKAVLALTTNQQLDHFVTDLPPTTATATVASATP